MSSDVARMVDATRRITAFAERPRRGPRLSPAAAVLGVHVEGPFLSPRCAGSHPVSHLLPPDTGVLRRLSDAGRVRTVTLAPERPAPLELIRTCAESGVVVSLGHRDAAAGQAGFAFAAGATAVTHLFNAMPPLRARAGGLGGAALARAGVALQLVADGVHVADPMLRLAFAAAPDRCSLVSDAIAAAAMADGSYPLGDVTVGVARRGDGTLAGSAVGLAAGMAHLRGIGISTVEALAAVTRRPARVLGELQIGRVGAGWPASRLIVDEELRIRRIVFEGHEIEPDPRIVC